MKGIIKVLIISLISSFAYAGVVINEINFYPQPWIELYNASPYVMHLDDYYLITPSGEYSLDNVSIEPNSYILLSKDRIVSHKDVQIDLELSNSGGFVILVNNNHVVDFVNWGVLSDEWKNSYPYLWDDAPMANTNLSRLPDGHDTNSPEDFKNTEHPTPLSSNAPMGLDRVSWSRIKALFRDAHKRM